MVVLINRGGRTWDLKDGKDKDGNPVKRKLPPGGSIDALDDDEAKYMLGYHREIFDAEKTIKPVADKIDALTKERDELLAQNAEMQAKLDDSKKGKKDK